MEILRKIQKELKAPKNQKNTFGNYKYRSCEDILEAVKPLLEEAELIITDEIVIVGDRYYVKATVKIKQGTEEVIVTAYAREPETKKGMDESQITGSSSSYARKYALNGLFLIDDTKDADTMDNSKNEVEELKRKADKITDIDELRKFMAKNSGHGKEFDNYIIELSKKLKQKNEVI